MRTELSSAHPVVGVLLAVIAFCALIIGVLVYGDVQKDDVPDIAIIFEGVESDVNNGKLGLLSISNRGKDVVLRQPFFTTEWKTHEGKTNEKSSMLTPKNIVLRGGDVEKLKVAIPSESSSWQTSFAFTWEQKESLVGRWLNIVVQLRPNRSTTPVFVFHGPIITNW